MIHKLISEAQIVQNSKQDGTVKIKMATVGERNLNGLLLKNKNSLHYESNTSYPLFFEHKTDMDNLIGVFQPTGVEGSDIMAQAEILNPKAKELVEHGAIHSASVTYEVKDCDYDNITDTVIINDANLIELSLVLNPADPTAKILNSKTKNELIKKEGTQKMTDEQFKELSELVKSMADAIKTLPDTLAEALKAESDDEKSSEDSKDKKPDATAPKDDNTAENSKLSINDLKKKWGVK